MSYNIIEENEILAEGVTFIQQKYPLYDKNRLIDSYSGDKYSLQMIEKSVDETTFNSILLMVLFDALIGNSDRHPSNWGVIYTVDTFKGFYTTFSPLYDNGSSLCAYEDSDNIDIFFKDKMKFDALINTKSKSAIGWNNIRPIRHFELIEKIKENYYDKTEKYVKIINSKITDESIQNILDDFSIDIINENMKRLIKKFILDRKNIILEIYNMKDEG